MKNNLVICDTNIFISAFMGDAETISILKNKIHLSNIVISAITYMELCRGAMNKKQLSSLVKDLRGYRVVNFNEAVSGLAMSYIQKYHLSHGLQIPDAIIAASAVTFEIPLFTYNLKDFKYIEKIKLLTF